MNTKLFTFITFLTISSLVSCVTYLQCSQVKNAVDRCECYVRLQTTYLSETCNSTNMRVMKDIVYNACHDYSWCTDAFARNDDNCPGALLSYGTTSCLTACMKKMKEDFTHDHTLRNVSTCLRINNDKRTFCNGAGGRNAGRICSKEWRKQA